jgi:integrase
MAKRDRRDRDGVFLRKGAYYISFNDAQGRRKQRKLQGVHTVTQARHLRNVELQKAEKARVLGYTPPGKETLGEMIPRYIQHQRARLTPKAFDRTRGVVEGHLRNFFGSVRIADIRRTDIQRYITLRSGEVGPASVIKEINILKHLLNLAVEWEIIPINPAQSVKLPKAPAGRVRYLQPGELRSVLDLCPDWLRPIAALLVFTGMRRSEVLGLRWLNVDLHGSRILLPQTKNGEGRIVYLNESAATILRSLPLGVAADRIFAGNLKVSPEYVSLAFLRACRRAGIADFRLHDLRHTAASWMRMQGADIHTVASLLGHKDLRMAARYQHLSPQYLQDAVKQLDHVFALQDQSTGKALLPPSPASAASRHPPSR